MSDFIIIIFLFPIFFMIHEFEEIIMIQKWINHNQIKLTQRFPHLYPIIKKASKIDTHKFSIIVAEEFILFDRYTALLKTVVAGKRHLGKHGVGK